MAQQWPPDGAMLEGLSWGAAMHDRSMPSGHSKKSSRSVKEKRAAKVAKKGRKMKLRKGLIENR